MLAPSTRASIRLRSFPTSSIPRLHSRTLFGWKPRFAAYDSQLDPLYPRLIRHRTLKTRAKLLKTIRRRQQFEWDPDARPLIGHKHVRYASHWDGTNKPPRWVRSSESEDKQGKRGTNTGGYELSEKEKAWKKQVDAIRKRIETDPYEAVFGKRFEPFWKSPLVPQWIKEEMGLSTKNEPEKPTETTNESSRRGKSFPVSKTGNFEYDPVTGRMVPIPTHQTVSTQQEQTEVPAHVTWKPIVAKPRSNSEPATARSDKDDIPVQTFKPAEPAAAVQGVARPKHGDASVSQPPQGELDTLTATGLRASMGKLKRKENALNEGAEAQDQEKNALKQQIRDWDNSVTKLKDQVSAIVDDVSATQLGQHLPTSLSRHVQAPKPIENAQPLQSAVQRMQSKAEPEPADLDDAAAHESTEPIAKTASVPKDWYEQADILQSARVMRTTSTRPSPTMRWLNDMNARRAEYHKKKAAEEAESLIFNADKTARLEKTNAMLQAEVDAHKLAMSDHRDRSSQKIKSLRGEIETAYKQSSVHADAFRDRIDGLDKELASTKSTANDIQVKAIKERYSKKVAGLQKELERAYVQSSVHADEFTKRIKELEAELVRMTKAAGESPDAKQASKLREMQGEGDFCPNVVKFADSQRWYKQPSSSSQSNAQDTAKAEQNARDKALVSKVRSIYENAYGTIDTKHRQPRNVQTTALEGALAKYDKHNKCSFKDDGLESELTGKVINAANDVIKHETQIYAYKKDDLEAELSQRVALEAEKAAAKGYPYKKDDLEAELSQRITPEAESYTDRDYAYKRDSLESELQQQAKLSNPEQSGRRFVHDSLEAELKEQGKSVVGERSTQRFDPNDLEAELKQQGTSGSGDKVLERELKIQEAHRALKRPSKFKPDGLEAELQRLAKKQFECASDEYEAEAAKHDKVGKMEKIMASSLGSELYMPARSATSTRTSASGVQWQQPPLYKIVAYDSGNDRFSTDTTTSWDPTVKDTPITTPQALSQLYQPARWMQHFASLQRDGYQVVHAREDLLVLKKVHEAGKEVEVTKHGSNTTKSFDTKSPVNPVDGTRSNKNVRPATGDYASPTGYVNLDAKETDLATNAEQSPRIKRQELVFSGSQRVRSGSRRARREAERERQQAYQSKERQPRSLALWMLGVAGATSGVMYVTGSVAEKAKAARMERETRALEADKADKGRWRLDDGEWRRGR